MKFLLVMMVLQPEYSEKYRSLEAENVRVISSEKNIGRAAIRNKLALEAKGDYPSFY